MSNRFKKGDRVRMTEYAKSQFPRSGHTGTVAMNAQSTRTVHVRPDGRKFAQSYAASFWELIPTEGSDGRRESSSDTERLNQ
jgi:hypothetical protein